MKKVYWLAIFVLVGIIGSQASAQDVIHYWHFNDTPNNVELGALAADFSVSTTAPTLVYQDAFPAVATTGFMDNVAGTELNQKFNTAAGRGIRPRNPSDSMELVINLPTTGYENILFSYATQRSNNGMQRQIVYYSTDGNSYTQFGDSVNISVNWEIKNFDFSSIQAANDNPNFKIKILFFVNNSGTDGNNRFDNIALEGNAIVPVDVNGISVSPSSLQLTVGQTAQLSAQVLPINANNQNFTWSSSNSSIASVNSNGLVTALDEGVVFIIATTAEGGFSDSAIVNVTEPIVSERELIYYWHFNTLETPQDVTVINADFSLNPNFTPQMVYTNPSGGRDIDVFTTGSNLNLQLGEVPGLAARVRNPSLNRSLEFNISTLGVRDVSFQYVVQRSGNGMLQNIVEYSIDGGETWTNNGLSQNIFDIQNANEYVMFEVDFEGISGVDNNDDFKLRITFEGNTTGDNGNNRFDNITMMGIVEDLSLVSFKNALNVEIFPNPTQGQIFVKGLDNNSKNQISVIDINGKVLLNTSDLNQLNFSNFDNGVYFVLINADGKSAYHKIILNK